TIDEEGALGSGRCYFLRRRRTTGINPTRPVAIRPTVAGSGVVVTSFGSTSFVKMFGAGGSLLHDVVHPVPSFVRFCVTPLIVTFHATGPGFAFHPRLPYPGPNPGLDPFCEIVSMKVDPVMMCP